MSFILVGGKQLKGFWVNLIFLNKTICLMWGAVWEVLLDLLQINTKIMLLELI
jgi:hypothetical protein